jgi:hypothetical protein
VQTHQIHVSNGRDKVHEIRSKLFVFPEVLDVLAISRPDAIVVVCWGRPRPAAWLNTLRAVGYQVSPRRHATAAGLNFDRRHVAARPKSVPALPPTVAAPRRAA